jgi:pyruvate formate lyase activating enzyme
MKIIGFKESSLNEWDGHISSVIWTSGCNWRCSYCHAKQFVDMNNKLPEIKEEMIFDYIKSKSGWIDSLCVSGGEPTIQPDLIEFMQRAKSLGILIKLETNGSDPFVLETLITKKLIDCLCLDFKQLPNLKLLNINKQGGGLFNVLQSFDVAFNHHKRLEIEFHTTLCPVFIDLPDIDEMGIFIHNVGTWILQQYDPTHAMNPDIAGDRIYDAEQLEKIMSTAKKHHKNVILKNANLD